jgi:hypothetical protein
MAMTCCVCKIKKGVQKFRCRLCGTEVGNYCTDCFLGKKVYESVEENCKKGIAHRPRKNRETSIQEK